MAGSDRARALVEIAYRHIAERGLEGLRVRAVAQEAGINQATLLYHFPTKEALIQGVVASVGRAFQTTRLPAETPSPQTAFDELLLEVEDARIRFGDNPDLLVVLTELEIRSRHDEVIGRILGSLYEGWRRHLSRILTRGVDEGGFRAELDVDAAAAVIMAQFKGIFGLRLAGSAGDPAVDRLLSELRLALEGWLLEGNRAKGAR